MLPGEIIRRLNAIDDRLDNARAGSDNATQQLIQVHKDLVFLREVIRQDAEPRAKEEAIELAEGTP